MRVTKPLLTAEELLHLPDTGRRLELLEGELSEMPPAGGPHGNVAMTIGMFIAVHVRERQLGRAFAAETGFVLARNPDTVRAPDASFVSYDRLAQGELPPGYIQMAPDLAVEVTSPSDSARDVQEKADAWLAAGTSEVWVVSPQHRTVTMNRLGEPATVIDESGCLHGGNLLPGLVISVQALFE